MMAQDLLLEIGTEEIPARFMPAVLAQLKSAAAQKLADLRIPFEKVASYGTPRRMVLYVSGLAAQQTDSTTENRGPSTKIAFSPDGKPTKAAMGFARGQGVDVGQLTVRDGYVYASVHETGRCTCEILPEVLPVLIKGLSFPKNMHWGELDIQFVRPIRWIVALYGDAVVKFTIGDVSADRVSRGHRFLGKQQIVIPTAQDYFTLLEENAVIVDQNKREQIILRQIQEQAAAHGGKAEIKDDLLEEVIYLVEFPTALTGSFDAAFLQLPPEAIITPMREQQRYFPVKDDDGKLLPLFITVRNGNEEYIDNVRRGNERVLRARLADAQFFFNEDLKQPLAQRVEKLKTVIFQEERGNLYDKTQRLIRIFEAIAAAVGVSEEDKATGRRAAYLAKADLVTGMVCEFTELQGTMGREYALKSGETAPVADAIFEHYLPRYAGDRLPVSTAGRILSIADKMDNIVATLSRGLLPTGSGDPYALRRQALGIVNIVIDAGYRLSLRQIASLIMDLFEITDDEAREKLQTQLAEFLTQRLKGILSEKGIRYDLVDAALAGGADDLNGCYLRAVTLMQKSTEPDFAAVVNAFTRTGNLAKQAQAGAGCISPDLFQETVERNLYAAYLTAQKTADQKIAAQDYAAAFAAFLPLVAPIDAFFTQVMVMVDDMRVRNNRLALLCAITSLSQKLAEFRQIVI